MIDIPLDRAITDSILFPLFVVDEDAKILSFNRTAAEAIGGCGASSKKVREQSDQWKSMDQYLRDNLDLDISHGLCPECQKKYCPEIFGQAPQ